MTKLEHSLLTILTGEARELWDAYEKTAGRSNAVSYAVGQAALICRMVNLPQERYAPALTAFITNAVSEAHFWLAMPASHS